MSCTVRITISTTQSNIPKNLSLKLQAAKNHICPSCQSLTQSFQSSQKYQPKINNLNNILFWNCNSIKHKINELQIFARLNNINIILLLETRISPSTILKIPNYFLPTNKTAHLDLDLYQLVELLY